MPTSNSPQKDLKELIEVVGFDAIGQRIRRVRTRANLTIRQLAEKAQISKNTLLSLEHGNPTHISTIRVICRALKMKPTELAGQDFIQPAVVSIQRKSEQVWHDMNSYSDDKENPPLTDSDRANPVIAPFCRLSSRFPGGSFNPHIVEIKQATPTRSHTGEEFVFVFEGLLRVNVGTQSFDLHEGDSMCFWAAETHNYEPVGDVTPVRILSIILDPLSKTHKTAKTPKPSES